MTNDHGKEAEEQSTADLLKIPERQRYFKIELSMDLVDRIVTHLEAGGRVRRQRILKGSDPDLETYLEQRVKGSSAVLTSLEEKFYVVQLKFSDQKEASISLKYDELDALRQDISTLWTTQELMYAIFGAEKARKAESETRRSQRKRYYQDWLDLNDAFVKAGGESNSRGVKVFTKRISRL